MLSCDLRKFVKENPDRKKSMEAKLRYLSGSLYIMTDFISRSVQEIKKIDIVCLCILKLSAASYSDDV